MPNIKNTSKEHVSNRAEDPNKRPAKFGSRKDEQVPDRPLTRRERVQYGLHTEALDKEEIESLGGNRSL